MFRSFCQSQRQSMSQSSWLYFQNIFSICSFIFILSTTTLGQSIMTHLGNNPLLPPSLAICLLLSKHRDVFNLLTRSYFSSIENLQCLPITLGIKHKLSDMANKSTFALVLANFTDLISYLPTICLILLLFPLRYFELLPFPHHDFCYPRSFFVTLFCS